MRAIFDPYLPCCNIMNATHYTRGLLGEDEALFPQEFLLLDKFFKFVFGLVTMKAL